MVSKLREASEFYNLQKRGKIANVYSPIEKLKKDSKGFYLLRKTKAGIYKQRVKSDDLVYTRAETGVTKYEKSRDKDKTDIKTYQKSTPKEHLPYQHMGDRIAKSSNKIYKI